MNRKISIRYAIIVAFSLFILLSVFTIKQYVITKNFAFFYDQRIEFIKTKKNYKSSYIYVKPLPDSGVIPSQEVNEFGAAKIGFTTLKLGKLNGVKKEIYLKKRKV